MTGRGHRGGWALGRPVLLSGLCFFACHPFLCGSEALALDPRGLQQLGIHSGQVGPGLLSKPCLGTLAASV